MALSLFSTWKYLATRLAGNTLKFFHMGTANLERFIIYSKKLI